MKTKLLLLLLLFFINITINAQVGIGTNTPAASAKLDITSTNKGFLPPRVALTATSDVSTIASPATGLLVYNTATAGTAPNNVVPGYYYYNGTAWVIFTTGITHYIGETYGGGIVFYVTSDGLHGLIAATADQSTSMRWYAGTNTNTMALADGVGAGLKNTAIIIANQGNGDAATYAARVCNEYSVAVNGVTYGDWYLPSKTESYFMYANIGQGSTNIGGFANSYYWSSTDGGTGYAYVCDFYYTGNLLNVGKNYPYHVRAIRAF